MICEFVDIEKAVSSSKIKNVKCFCHFCKGEVMRADVRHLKVFFPDGREYFMNIADDGKMEILEKI